MIVQVFKKEHIPQYMDFVFDAYVSGEEKFSVLGSPKPEFDKDTLKMIEQFVEGADYVNKLRGTNTPFNTFIRIDGKMAATSFTCELHYFMRRFAEGYIPQPIYQHLPPNILEENPQFTGLIVIRNVVRPEFLGKGLFEVISLGFAKVFREQGYKNAYAIMVNQKLVTYFKRRNFDVTPFKYNRDGKVVDLHLLKLRISQLTKSKL